MTIAFDSQLYATQFNNSSPLVKQFAQQLLPVFTLFLGKQSQQQQQSQQKQDSVTSIPLFIQYIKSVEKVIKSASGIQVLINGICDYFFHQYDAVRV